MKQKLIYLFIFICFPGFFSSAKQAGKKCDADFPFPLKKQECSKQIQPALEEETVSGISPFSLFMFNI